MDLVKYLVTFLCISISIQAKPIDYNIVKEAELVIQDWLNYYQVDFHQFKCTSDVCFTSIPTRIEYGIKRYQPIVLDEESIHNRDFEVEDDGYDPVLYDYSPSRRYYLNVRVTAGVYNKESHYFYDGGDDCQEIYLYDRQRKRADMVLWLGSSQFAEAAFWDKRNRFFVIVGRTENNRALFAWINGIWYELPYEIKSNQNYFKKVLKDKKIITDRL